MSEFQMTPERAKEIITAQNQWPYWGNFSRFMTPDEIGFVRNAWLENPNGNSSFASTVYRIANNETLKPEESRPCQSMSQSKRTV